MAELSHYSEGEESSVDAPPPPPPTTEGRGNEDQEEERYQEQLKVFKEMAEFSAANEQGADFVDDGSVEVSSPEKYEKMGDTVEKGGGTKYGMIAACLVIILAIILGVGFGTGAFTGDDGESTSTAPTQNTSPEDPLDGETVAGENVATPSPDSRQGRIRSYIASKAVNGDSSISDPTTPEAQALQWLQDEDPLQLDPLDSESNFRIDQRYALLTLWFNSQSDWFDQTNWLSDDECTWFGVTCGEPAPENRRERKLQENSTVITRLEIEGNNLQGSIPLDLSLLEDLKILNLASNALAGPIPTTIANLGGLTTVVLTNNALTGDMSGIDFSKLSAVQILDVASNNLQGALPDSLWSMPAVNVLVMDNNQFSGRLPASISTLQSLRKCTFLTN